MNLTLLRKWMKQLVNMKMNRVQTVKRVKLLMMNQLKQLIQLQIKIKLLSR